MTARATVAALAALMLFSFVAAASAWKGRLQKSVVTISQAQQMAEEGDPFVIEGEITANVRAGVDNVFVLNDGTGEMMIRIPDIGCRHGRTGPRFRGDPGSRPRCEESCAARRLLHSRALRALPRKSRNPVS